MFTQAERIPRRKPMTLRVPLTLAKAIKAAAVEDGMTINDWVQRCFKSRYKPRVRVKARSVPWVV